VLDAARELFGERGYHATSIAEIGARARISKSVLYHYFPSKARLYEAIVEAETRDLIEHVRAAVPSDPSVPRLRVGVDAYLGYLAAHPAAWRLLVRDPPADAALIRLHERLAGDRSASLADLIATATKQAENAAHIALVAVAIRAFAAWWYEHPDVPRERVVEAIVDVARAGAQLTAPLNTPASPASSPS
jgi:AcrR family transcriptional regulator